MAFAHDLAKVSKITSITFAVGQYRWHVVNYLGQEQTGYHMSKYNDALEAVDGFLADYEAAYQESQSLAKTSKLSRHHLPCLVIMQTSLAPLLGECK